VKLRTTCAHCGQPKTIPAKMQKGVSRLDFERDPYCSRTCAQADLGIEDPRSPLISTSGRLGGQGQRKVSKEAT
jgi:endogenous inhibitor of DNA gyrase (YacG/DUF329 family)